MNKEIRKALLHIGLFLTTLVTTTIAGAWWVYGKAPWVTEFTWSDFLSGFEFSVPFLLILTVHEFGHYFTAMYHKVKATLPFYIPFPPIPFSIGTLGAVIRIKSRVSSNIQHFDIGLAGPLSGFIVAVVVIVYAFATLPPPEYIFKFHPEYEAYGLDYADHVYGKDFYVQEFEKHKQEGQELPEETVNVTIGTNLFFMLCAKWIADPARVPHPNEMMHYPLLMAGFLALFFTSLNLLPIGQLDGGHVVYGLFGRKGHQRIAVVFFFLLLTYSGLGYIDIWRERDQLPLLVPLGVMFFYFCLMGLKRQPMETLMYALIIVAFLLAMAFFFPKVHGYSGWLIFGLLVGRMLGVYHPPSEIEVPLNPGRQILGWICLIIFIFSFSPQPIVMTEILLK